MAPPPPVPKPRARYSWDSLDPAHSAHKDSTDPDPFESSSGGNHLIADEDAPPPPPLTSGGHHGMVYPTLAGVTDISAAANPSLNGVATSIRCGDPPSPTAPLSTDCVTNYSHTPNFEDVGALSQFVTDVNFPPVEGTAKPAEEGSAAPPMIPKEYNPYITVLSCWVGQEEADTELSSEEEDTGLNSTTSGSEGPMKNDPVSEHSNTSNNLGRTIPTRPAPPPPCASSLPGRIGKHKTPRAATIRVSRKKEAGTTVPQGTVIQSSWLDVWKGFKHNVIWATLDGQLMSLWKKRTDHFSEVLFHVSSITNVKKQDKCRFSIYFRKKHYDFMAHNDEVQNTWVTSLLASRGQPSPASPKIHGPITIKDPRTKVYGAVLGHDLWIYPNKEGFQLGVASYCIPLNTASVKSTGRHSFQLITPYRSFSLSVDSVKDLPTWLDCLSSSICSALSNSQVAMRLWENPCNTVCGDCGAASPEWASVNLLLVICQSCAGQHRALGSNLSKVRSLKMDSKVWTEPLIQLFVAYGNWLANQIWAPVVPASEQLQPDWADKEKSKFIQDKYSRGRYRRVHALASSQKLMDQRLREVICTNDIEETMYLICSGAKVCRIALDGSPNPIQMAERAGKALQIELLRLNEYTEIPPYQPQLTNRRVDYNLSGKQEEELHGKLEDDRFLFSLENDSAACDVLDLREVLSIFRKDAAVHQFEMVTLDSQLICAADNEDELLTHLLHIMKVILPAGVSYAEVGGASAVSKVCVAEAARAPHQSDAWLLLWEGGVSIYPVQRCIQQPLRIEPGMLCHHSLDLSENVITLTTADRCVLLRFEEEYSCHAWFSCLQGANQTMAPAPTIGHKMSHLYPEVRAGMTGSVSPAVERCINHIKTHGLKVEGIYRRCGLATKVARLVEALIISPSTAPLECDEQGVLDVAAALKQYIRQQEMLFPEKDRHDWLQAAVISDERSRFSSYRELIQQQSVNKQATLSAFFGHFYMVQLFSQVNKMSAHNLAVVLVPSLFQIHSPDLLRLTWEFIIHHSLLFLKPEKDDEEYEQITIL